MKNLLWYMFAGTRGGITRVRIIDLIRNSPANANKISEILKLDYKTIRHHLKAMEKNSLIYAINKEKYGAVYFLSEIMESNIDMFDEILDKIGKDLGKS